MLKRIVVLTLLLASVISPRLSAQSKMETRDSFYDAESWILFEDYKEALPLYLQLLKIYPDNANIKYRIGECYLNIPGQKEKSIGFLEEAVKHINPKYREGKFKETGAPYDALYYLANAYRISNQLDKAIRTYEEFRKNLDPDIYDSTVVDLQIQSCKNAGVLMKTPVYVKKTNLGMMINEGGSEFDPVVSYNEDMIVFARSEAFYDAILYSRKVNGKWTSPVNLNQVLKTDRDLYPSSVSKDGNTLYLYNTADYDGTIFTSEYKNGTWQPMVRLNDNINTKYWESHATISHDNKKLYFTSNRKGTIGGLDIYVSARDSTGDWGPAFNLGPVINTPYNEESPFLTSDDKTLYFSSRGHYNMGGYDIFYSTLLDNGEWSKPLNAGYPLNTTDDDVFYNPQKQGYDGYYAMQGEREAGQNDIYRIEVFSDQHPRKFIIRGVTTVADLMKNFPDSVRISAFDRKNNRQLLTVYSDPSTGKYEFELSQGNYQLTYESPDGKKVVKDLDIPLLNPSDSLNLSLTVLPKKDYVARLEVNSEATISVTRGDTVAIPVKAEPESVLKVEHWVGDSLLSSDRYVIHDSLFTYRVVPKKGDNRINFMLTDRFSNTASAEVNISRKRPAAESPLIRPERQEIIANKQARAFASMMESRSEGRLADVIKGSVTGKNRFTGIDAVTDYIKSQAEKENISPDEVDKVALAVARKDNVLSQASVDLMAKYAFGELKTVLSGMDIKSENLKTWSDLQTFVEDKTMGRITGDRLNAFADDILNGRDPAIALLREKLLAISRSFPKGDIIRKSVEVVDGKDIKTHDKWLEEFSNEALREGLTPNELAGILAAVSAAPGTTVEQYLSDLITSSEEPLASILRSVNTAREKISSPGELILYLLNNKDRLGISAEELFRALSNLTASADLPSSALETTQVSIPSKAASASWLIPVLGGAALIFIIFFIVTRRKKKEKKEE